jgi:ADP-L-glycero-D-manno-heptose 6-epimerase
MIVVTGAGFIGGRIIATLANQRSAPVLAVEDDLTPAKQANLAGVNLTDLITSAEFQRFAETDPGFTRRVDAVIHLAAHTDTWERDLALVLERNLGYSARLLHWCLRSRIPLIYSSSAAVYGAGRHRPPHRTESLAPYPRSKLLFDRSVQRLLPMVASPLVGLRFFNVYGPGEAHKERMASVVYQFHRQLHATGRIEIYAHPSIGRPGSQRRDLVHVDDVVAATTWFLDQGGAGIYDIGTGQATSFARLAQIVLDHEGFGAIQYPPLPAHLVGSYQAFTRANLAPLRAAGFAGDFRPPEAGVPAYLRYLNSAPVPR